jgi:two-component system OmpR family response regulator
MHLLVIEDDPTLNQNICDALQAEHYVVDQVFDGQMGLRQLKKKNYACVIMDINLPGINGFELCKSFRTFNTSTPVIMLTAFNELEDKVTGFDSGADDYVTKPFFMRELLLRIQNIIKRLQHSNTHQNGLIIVDDITINTFQKKVTCQHQEILLTPREYQILLKLCKHKSEIVSKQALLDEIWGTHVSTNTNTIEVYVNFLRNKIDKPFGKNRIKTKVGFGYYLEV